MPRIKRWFPVSHDINADPEVIDLTDRFGLSGLKVWLEILSVADRNEGVFGTDWQSIIRSLSIKCNTTQRQVSGILECIKSRLWVSSELPARVAKYSEYHKTRGTNKVPSEPSEPILTYPTHKNEPKPVVSEPSADPSLKKKTLDPEIKIWADKVFATDPEKFKRLVVWIKAAERTYAPHVIANSLERFLPYAAGFDGNWFPYLDKILDKEEAHLYGRETEAESNRFKREEARYLSRRQ